MCASVCASVCARGGLTISQSLYFLLGLISIHAHCTPGWNDREIKTFSYHFAEVDFRRNDIIYNIGEKAEYLFFILEGEFTLQSKMPVPIDSQDTFASKYQPQYYRQYVNVINLLKRDIFGEEQIFQIKERQFRAICYSLKGKVYKILFDDFKKRIWDPQSRKLLI